MPRTISLSWQEAGDDFHLVTGDPKSIWLVWWSLKKQGIKRARLIDAGTGIVCNPHEGDHLPLIRNKKEEDTALFVQWQPQTSFQEEEQHVLVYAAKSGRTK